MFKKETVLLLGAGASAPYGYPLGRQLIDEIIKVIDHDEFYLPVGAGASSRGMFNLCPKDKPWESERDKIDINFSIDDIERMISDAKYVEVTSKRGSFNKLRGAEFPTYKHELFVHRFTESNASLSGVYLCKRRFGDIDFCLDFKSLLVEFDPPSIDSFLRDHVEYEKIGRVLILYVILKFENKKKFLRNNLKSKNDSCEVSKSWYPILRDDLCSGFEAGLFLQHNKLSIVTFNYDISLDYYLYYMLGRISKFNKKTSDDAKSALDVFYDKFNIVHVYGQVREGDDVKSYGMYSTENKTDDLVFDNFRRLRYAILHHKNIKLINRESGLISPAVNIMRKAERIVSLGFSFDRDNLNILGFPKEFLDYKRFLKNKELLGVLNYEGQNRALSRNINKIQREILDGSALKCKIFESQSNNIALAYLNDFKEYLYLD